MKIENVKTLRNELCNAFLWVKDDPRRGAQVKEMANVSGKIINSVRLEIEYAGMRKEKPDIEFLK